jgi:DNA-binding transcriptional LysR family regulator
MERLPPWNSNQLRYFCAVVRAGSLTRAAEQLGIAQPSLSQQIRALEKQIGTPLFERLGRSIRLTSYGETLSQRAINILQQVAEAQSSLDELQGGVRGRLNVGVIPTILPYLIAPRIGEFLTRFPELELHLTEDTTPRLIEQLQAGELDLAVSGLPVRNPDVICSELAREPLFLAVAASHPMARKRSADLHDLQGNRLLLLTAREQLSSHRLFAGETAFRQPPNARIHRLAADPPSELSEKARTKNHGSGSVSTPFEHSKSVMSNRPTLPVPSRKWIRKSSLHQGNARKSQSAGPAARGAV